MATSTVTKVGTALNDAEIANRVKEVEEYERFSVFKFAFHSEHHVLEVLNSNDVLVLSADGSTYIGYVEDWDDSFYYVNLR